MPPEPRNRASGSIEFRVWKQSLQNDCKKLDKLRAFEALPESVLELLWESGLEPTVKALVENARNKQPS
jgi:hypothetical protein